MEKRQPSFADLARSIMGEKKIDPRTQRPMSAREHRRWRLRDDAAQAKKATRAYRRQQRQQRAQGDRLLAVARVADGQVEATPETRQRAQRTLEAMERAPEIAAELAEKKAARRAEHEANRRRNLEAMA